MRWWLGLAFALIAAVTATAVATVFSNRSESALRERAEEIALGSSVEAADAIDRGIARGDLEGTLAAVTERRELAVFVYDLEGNLLTPSRSLRTDLEQVPLRGTALGEALAGRTFVASFDNGKVTLVALPLSNAGGMLVYASRPDLAAGLGIAQDEIVEAAIWATLVGAVAGLLVASLITARLRRIASAAAAIEAGSFDRAIQPRFRDELGLLAETIERMRVRLRDSFEALEAERDRLHRLLERLQEGVVTVDADLRIEFANGAARRLLGVEQLAEGDALPEPWPDFSLRRLSETLFGPDAAVIQLRVSPSDELTFELAGIPAGTESSAAMLVIADVTERERRERAQREFVTNAAHELRTPLAVIAGAVEVLQSGAKEDEVERDRFLDHIERESARLGRLARALLVLARAQTRAERPRLEAVELQPLLEDISVSLRLPEGVSIRVACPPGIAVLAQRDLMEQVVANLAVNAVRYTEQGDVMIAVRALPGASVAIEVSDRGPGIAAEQQERVWERFYRGDDRDGEGFGLGLSIVRQAVHTLGGTVTIDSRLGRGATVRVVLPAAQLEPETEPAVPAAAQEGRPAA
jgi:two-component system, OmpR family, phosphate regulon sensor histidine kinase PhoR